MVQHVSQPYTYYVELKQFRFHSKKKKTNSNTLLLRSFSPKQKRRRRKMYRTAAKRLLCGARYYNGNAGLRFRRPQMLIACSRFYATESQPFPNPHSTNDSIPVHTTEIPNVSDSASSSSSSSTAEDARFHETQKPGAKYEDEQSRLLHASLSHVVRTFVIFIFFLIFISVDCSIF